MGLSRAYCTSTVILSIANLVIYFGEVKKSIPRATQVELTFPFWSVDTFRTALPLSFGESIFLTWSEVILSSMTIFFFCSNKEHFWLNERFFLPSFTSLRLNLVTEISLSPPFSLSLNSPFWRARTDGTDAKLQGRRRSSADRREREDDPLECKEMCVRQDWIARKRQLCWLKLLVNIEDILSEKLLYVKKFAWLIGENGLKNCRDESKTHNQALR